MVDLVHNAGIRIRELEAEVARLKRRLEIAHAYDGAGNEIPFPAGMEHLDGIACRDETIRQQDEQIAKLRDRAAVLESALKPFADAGAGLPDTVADVAPAARVTNDRRSAGSITTVYACDFRAAHAALSGGDHGPA